MSFILTTGYLIAGAIDKTSFTYLLTSSTQHSHSSECIRFLRQTGNSAHFLNPKVHYRIHKCSPPVHIQRQLDTVHIPTSHLLNFHLCIIFPSMSASPKMSLSLKLPHQNPVYSSLHPYTLYASPISNLSIFLTRKILGEHY